MKSDGMRVEKIGEFWWVTRESTKGNVFDYVTSGSCITRKDARKLLSDIRNGMFLPQWADDVYDNDKRKDDE